MLSCRLDCSACELAMADSRARSRPAFSASALPRASAAATSAFELSLLDLQSAFHVGNSGCQVPECLTKAMYLNISKIHCHMLLS